jgi:hypothetical protein
MFRWRYVSPAEGMYLQDFFTAKTQEHVFGLPSPLASRSCFVNVLRSPGSESSETNVQEMAAVRDILSFLVRCGVCVSRNVSVLTPYKAQKALLEGELFGQVCPREFATVDEFQGSQNDFVIVSLVSNSFRPSPFLCDEQRINVMTSRARRCLVFVGNLSTFCRSPEWLSVIRRMDSSTGSFPVHDSHGNVMFLNDTRDLEDVCLADGGDSLSDLRQSFSRSHI